MNKKRLCVKCRIRRRMGANAVIGVDLDYETVGSSGGMLMVTASGTTRFILSSIRQKQPVCDYFSGFIFMKTPK